MLPSYENENSPTPLASLRQAAWVNRTHLRGRRQLKLTQRQGSFEVQASQWSMRIVILVGGKEEAPVNVLRHVFEWRVKLYKRAMAL